MKLYFDTEFTGLTKDAELISIGIIDEDGRSFYAEFSDFHVNKCSDWVKQNVIAKLYNSEDKDKKYEWILGVADTQVYGTKKEIKEELEEWLSAYDTVEFVSDVCHYDFVLLIDLFGSAFDLPKNICAACHDINQDIAKYYNISETKAFDVCREDMVRDIIKSSADKHNALWDARVIAKIYELVNKPEKEEPISGLARTDYKESDLLHCGGDLPPDMI